MQMLDLLLGLLAIVVMACVMTWERHNWRVKRRNRNKA
jgi:hypothetical protein